MLRVFQNDITTVDRFTVTLELVPGRESMGRSVDAVMGIARDAFADGRISAVSITDNPGGNPSLSPDVIGLDIFNIGMDVIVHFTCRDMNRVAMESRALQLAMMGIKNILALNGDYAGKGFGGQGAPVFDLDSVQLQILLQMIGDRMLEYGDPDEFFAGCAVSPFKQTEGECFAQYAKLCRKVAAGAQFIITQLGYDWRKFQELILMMAHMGMGIPAIGTVYLLTPKAAGMMNAGRVPGAVVTDRLRRQVEMEWRNKPEGRRAAIERAARLAAVMKGLGYRGIHLGGIHRNFDIAGRILDRLETIGDQWQDFVREFDYPQSDGFYAFIRPDRHVTAQPLFNCQPVENDWRDQLRYLFLKKTHHLLFNDDHGLTPHLRRIAQHLDGRLGRQVVTDLFEHPSKALLLDCRMCGDCGIQHVGFLCPESQCPKHIRNGACGGSHHSRCEVYPERYCVWFKAYRRLARDGNPQLMVDGCVPPRMWELDRTSSWLNFHLGRDHESVSSEIMRRCRRTECRL